MELFTYQLNWLKAFNIKLLCFYNPGIVCQKYKKNYPPNLWDLRKFTPPGVFKSRFRLNELVFPNVFFSFHNSTCRMDITAFGVMMHCREAHDPEV